ncbi:MAG: cupredoxin family protein [Burkholderiaceae bacterium]|nr:cupredoxin family protein [Burkholderiaceae bacterium]
MQHGRHEAQQSQREQHDAEGQHQHSEHGMRAGDAVEDHPHVAVNGQPGDPAKVDRVIDMTMDDTMRFTPDRITVKAGETVRFFLKNTGKVPHEFVIGSMDELREHAEMMRRMPEMRHEEPNSITLAPRQIGAVVWQFERPGPVDFACLVPGHFEAGMAGKVLVE